MPLSNGCCHAVHCRWPQSLRRQTGCGFVQLFQERWLLHWRLLLPGPFEERSNLLVPGVLRRVWLWTNTEWVTNDKAYVDESAGAILAGTARIRVFITPNCIRGPTVTLIYSYVYGTRMVKCVARTARYPFQVASCPRRPPRLPPALVHRWFQAALWRWLNGDMDFRTCRREFFV
jgi:hypothetical protein